MRVVEIRLLDGPNLYLLEPTVRVEVVVGRRRTWYGRRLPGRHALVRLGAPVSGRAAPRSVAGLAAWVRRLHRAALDSRVRVTIHRTSEPGHWVVAFPWREREKAQLLAETAVRLADERPTQLPAREVARIRRAGSTPPEWISDEQRAAGGHVPLISISGTNGKSTTTRMLTHIARAAGRHVGTTTTDGVLVDEQLVEPGDYTGPIGARAVLTRPDIELAVLETARGGILLRGLGYQSNEASVLTNVSADHLDLQGVHTLPELAEVKSVICRVTRPDGTVVLNADDPLVAGVGRRVRAPVVLFSERGTGALLRRHLARGGRAFVAQQGWLVELSGPTRRRRIVPIADVPATLGGLARHNVANALAAAAGAAAVGFSYAQIAHGLRDFRISVELMPGRLNLYLRDQRLVVVDYAHNVAGLGVLLDTIEALIGRRGRRRATLTVIVGSAGDRPDDALRELGRLAAARADELAIKEDLPFLRGRTRASVIGELGEGFEAAGVDPDTVPVYVDEHTALVGELTTAGRLAADTNDTPRVVILMCHAHREDVAAYLAAADYAMIEDPKDLNAFRMPERTRHSARRV